MTLVGALLWWANFVRHGTALVDSGGNFYGDPRQTTIDKTHDSIMKPERNEFTVLAPRSAICGVGLPVV